MNVMKSVASEHACLRITRTQHKALDAITWPTAAGDGQTQAIRSIIAWIIIRTSVLFQGLFRKYTPKISKFPGTPRTNIVHCMTAEIMLVATIITRSAREKLISKWNIIERKLLKMNSAARILYLIIIDVSYRERESYKQSNDNRFPVVAAYYTSTKYIKSKLYLQ